MDKFNWYQIGDGEKLHAFNPKENKSLCGIAGALTGPFALIEPRCLRCLEIMEKKEWKK